MNSEVSTGNCSKPTSDSCKRTRVFYESLGTNETPVYLGSIDDPELRAAIGHIVIGDIETIREAFEARFTFAEMTDKEVANLPDV